MVKMIEINATHFEYPGVNPGFLHFSRVQAEVIYRLLMEMGATKDIKFNWDEKSGQIHVMKKFYFQSSLMPSEDDSGDRVGDRFYTLQGYIKLLIRFDRSAYKRMQNVRAKIETMHSAVEKLQKQL